MNDISTHLNLTYLMPSQAQKHVTVNEAIRALDLIVQLAVLDRDLTSPPAAPADGDRYIVASPATGGWAGEDGKIAAWVDGAWQFFSAKAGWTVWIADEAAYFVHDGAVWSEISSASGIGAFSEIGIGGAASDATNKLAVQSPAVLFNHDGNGIQAKLNKAAVADTASVLFQTAFSGRAEFGLTGDDDWHVKVSPDGTNWVEAIFVDKDTGDIGFGDAAYTTVSATRDGVKAFFSGMSYGSNVQFEGKAANGTKASPTAIGINKILVGLRGAGYDGTAFSGSKGDITVRAQETWTASANGTYTRFDTTAPGGTSRTEKMRITGDGDVGIGVTNPAAKLDVDGVVKVKSYTVAALPTAVAGGVIYVSDETGGAVLAFGDGTNWRRVTDRAIVA